MMLVRLFSFVLGFALAVSAVYSAVQTFVLPRSAPDRLTTAVFRSVYSLFALRLRRTSAYEERDRALAFFAPAAVLTLIPVWYTFLLFGFAAMFWAVGVPTWYQAFKISGSSLLTLGFATSDGALQMVLTFVEAATGLILVALLIAYLPTMYSAFSRRETNVSMLEVRAGSPPSAVDMLLRFHRIHGLQRLREQWATWEAWFADIEESHTSLAPLVFFRSPRSDKSWVTAAGAVLDAAALTLSTLDIPAAAEGPLCVRAGYLALRRIADLFDIQYNPDPHFPVDAISVTRAEFDAACGTLETSGVPLKADRDQAWSDFAGWRVNYDRVLCALTWLTMAPPSPWSGARPTHLSLMPFRRLPMARRARRSQ